MLAGLTSSLMGSSAADLATVVSISFRKLAIVSFAQLPKGLWGRDGALLRNGSY